MIWPVFTNRSAGAKLRIGNLLGEWPVRQRGHSLYAEEKRVFRLIDKVGVDHIVFETDLLHPTSLYDEEVHAQIKGGLSVLESRRTVMELIT